MAAEIVAYKICLGCSELKAITEFSTKGNESNPNMRKRRQARCRPCVNAHHRAQRAADPTRYKYHRVYIDEIGQEVKKCRRCLEVKPTTEFHRQGKAAPAEYRPACLPCYRKEVREATAKLGKPLPPPIEPGAVKQCKTCEKVKPLTEFPAYTGRRFKPGFHAHCAPCFRAKTMERWRRRYAADPSVHKRNGRKQDFLRRARKQNAAVIETIDRAFIIERDHSTCYLCGKRLQPNQIALDHIVPLSRGGFHTADNLKVSCKSCNSRKCNRLLSELRWYQPQTITQ